MIQQFQDFSKEEANAFINAIPLITVLVAGADGEIDETEKEWATKLTHIRSYSHPDSLKGLYEAVSENFGNQVHELIESLPDDVGKRNAVISEKLEVLNEIFPKLENNFAVRLYKSLLSFAEHVAKASGGILRFGSISTAEKKWINLPMINPVEIE